MKAHVQASGISFLFLFYFIVFFFAFASPFFASSVAALEPDSIPYTRMKSRVEYRGKDAVLP